MAMTEIQEAFEKNMNYRDFSTRHFERWRQEWIPSVPGQVRYYASIVTEGEFLLFKAGWEARGENHD